MIAVRDKHGWRNEECMNAIITIDDYELEVQFPPSRRSSLSCPQPLEHRRHRLRLHGPHPLQRLAASQPLLHPRAQAGLEGLLRPARRKRQAGEVLPELGLRVDGVRLAEAHRPQGHRPDRRLRAQRPAPRHRARRGPGRQDDRLRKAAGDERGRGRGDGGRRREGGRGQHGLVQLSPRAGHLADQADHRRRPHRPAVPLSGHRTTRTTPSRPTCPRAAWPSGGWTPAWPAPA